MKEDAVSGKGLKHLPQPHWAKVSPAISAMSLEVNTGDTIFICPWCIRAEGNDLMIYSVA